MDDELRKAAEILNNDGVVVLPTETVYGIGTNSLSEKGINKLYELQNEYTDYFEEYTDNTNPKIKNEEVKKLCKIILNIIFSVPADMSIYDGLEQLMDDCNVPYYERDLFHIEDNSKLLFTNYLLVYFKFEER